MMTIVDRIRGLPGCLSDQAHPENKQDFRIYGQIFEPQFFYK
jgi:hypothetical protein